MKLTERHIGWLKHGAGGWFEPSGRGWRTCDMLARAGLMEHNGAERGKGERFRTTDEGRKMAPSDGVMAEE